MSIALVRPRELRHHGVVSAHGFLLSAELLGPAGQLHGALAQLATGARVLRLDARDREPAAWLVVLARPLRTRCETCVGAPLTRLESGHLATAPLTASELAGVSTAHGPSVLWLHDGALMQTPLDRCPEIDLSRHVALPELKLMKLAALTDPPPAIAFEARPKPRDVRSIFQAYVPPASEEQKAMLRSLSGVRGVAAGAHAVGSAVARMAGTALGALGRLFRRALVLGGTASGSRARSSAVARAPSRLSDALARPSLFSRLWSAAERRLRLIMLRSPLGALLSFRQARYLQQMMALFEERDLHEALRHAIPLAQPGSGGGESQPALGIPSARSDLSLSNRLAGGSGGAAFSSDALYAHLQKMYRAAALRLEREGKLHEAAFVYAELLGDAAAAVRVLELARAYREAAELAEGRKLPAGLVVRLWFLAKDVDRAVAYAIEHNAFSDAIRRLAAQDVPAADALRLTWAQRLAAAGRYSEAIDALWPVSDARHIALAWMERVIALGGLPASRTLARAIRFGRSEPRKLETAFRSMLEDAGDDAAVCRMELATRLTEAGAQDNTNTGRYLPALLRALVSDAVEGPVILDRAMRRAFNSLSPDTVLIADLPAEIPAKEHGGDARAFELEWRRDDVGSVAIFDVARLSYGSFTLALGESGIRMLSRDGRTRCQLALPAEELIVSDTAQVAISIMRRGTLLRLGHVDFVRGSATPWADTQLDAYARDHDGERWFVRRGDDVMCLDLLRTDLQARWHVSDRDFGQARVMRDESSLQIVSGDSPHIWRYELPGLTLRKRVVVSDPEHDATLELARAFDMKQQLVRVLGTEASPATFILEAHGKRVPLVETDGFSVDELIAVEQFAIVIYRIEHAGVGDMVIDVFATADVRRVFRCVARGASRVRARLSAGRLLIVDDRGRLLDYHLHTHRIVRDLRVHA